MIFLRLTRFRESNIHLNLVFAWMLALHFLVFTQMNTIQKQQRHKMLNFIVYIILLFRFTTQEKICALDFQEEYCVDLSAEDLELLKNPSYKTYSGHEIDWKNVTDGWTPRRRLEYLEQCRKTRISRQIVPKYTDFGFIKMEMPLLLSQFILDRRVESFQETEDCGVMRNCLTVKNNFLVLANNSAVMGMKNVEKVQDIVTHTMKPILEKWTGKKSIFPSSFFQYLTIFIVKILSLNQNRHCDLTEKSNLKNLIFLK